MAALAASAVGVPPRLRGQSRYVVAYHTRSYRRQLVVLEFAPSVFDRDVSSFNIAGFGHTLAEGGEKQ